MASKINNTPITIFRNSVFLFGSRILNMGSQLALVVVVSRILGPEGFGLYSFLTAIILIGNIAANFGLDTYMVRDISKGGISIPEYFGSIFSLKILLSLVTILGILILTLALPLEGNTRYLLILYALSILFHAPTEALWYAGDGLGRFKLHSFLWASANLLKAILGISTVFYFKRIEILILGLLSAEALSLVISWHVVRRNIGHFPVTLNLKSCKTYLRKAFPVALSSFLGVFYFRLDMIMLKIMKGSAVAGYYNAPYRIFEAFSIIPGTLMLVLFPLLSKSHGDEKDIFRQRLLKGFFILFIIGFLLACPLAFFSSHTINFLYGEAYRFSVSTLQVLAFAILFYFVNFYAGYSLISMGEERLNNIFLILATFLNFGLNIIIIPSHEHFGAAISTLFSEIVLFILYFIGLKHLLLQKSS